MSSGCEIKAQERMNGYVDLVADKNTSESLICKNRCFIYSKFTGYLINQEYYARNLGLKDTICNLKDLKEQWGKRRFYEELHLPFRTSLCFILHLFP